MVSTTTPPVTIPEKNSIARLIFFYTSVLKTDSREQGNQSFESNGQPQVNWTQVAGDQRPIIDCTVTMSKAKPLQIKVKGMIDKGLDITIISAHKWPSSWPITLAGSAVAGIGGTT